MDLLARRSPWRLSFDLARESEKVLQEQSSSDNPDVKRKKSGGSSDST